MTLGCSLSAEKKEQIIEQEKESNAFWCAKGTDARLGGRNDPQWQRVYEECMVTGGR